MAGSIDACLSEQPSGARPALRCRGPVFGRWGV